MDFKDYQDKAQSTAIYPYEHKILYPALGLAGEAGEVANIVKKSIRDKDGLWSPEDRNAVAKELGDVLWYVAMVAADLNLDLDEIASGNIKKLLDRKNRGKLKGSGDDR